MNGIVLFGISEMLIQLVAGIFCIINVFVAGESAITVAVYNMSGQVVRHVSVNDNEANVDVENLPKGIYLIHAQGAKGRYTTRMVI